MAGFDGFGLLEFLDVGFVKGLGLFIGDFGGFHLRFHPTALLQAGADVFLQLLRSHPGLGDLVLEGLVIGELALDFGEFGIDIGIADFLSGGCLGHQLIHDQILEELGVAAELLLRVKIRDLGT